ncbi:hopanoid biosynthesis-associated protein HpnK [Lichenicoccus sp.]|uniref:hopanoid biosynthesis-associated protein HpnK n=1 Tax=Lichenicoccus sp. TaxID=2781899 RepID=UPI003D0C4063
MRRVIFSADDFGLSEEVNEGIERAHREGVLSTASLMVTGHAVADAVARARRMPGLRVGLHLVVIEGSAVLPPDRIPLLVRANRSFGQHQLGLGVRYFFQPPARRQLALEVAAQFRAYTATGLRLDHANAHKHMHLHPTVGALLITEGRRHGLPAIRIPYEPAGPIRLADATRDTAGAKLLRKWTRLLRIQARRAGLRTNDQCFGIAWSGHMTRERVTSLIPRLPPGLSEIYFHPASERGDLLKRLMPGYAHEAELATLCSPDLPAALERADVEQTGWSGGTA